MTLTQSAINNRKKLLAEMDNTTLAFVNSNDNFPSNSDGTLPYKPNADIYWLSGILQEETAILLFPGHPDPSLREVLFIKHVNSDFTKWHGKRLSKEEAIAISGIQTVYWETEIMHVFQSSANFASHIALNTIEHPRSENYTQTRDHRFIDWCQKRFPLHNYIRLAPVIGKLRYAKTEFELSQIQKANDITAKGFIRVLQFMKPGVHEKQIVAEMIHEYLQHDAEWADYQAIVASGENSCILHYISNHNTCKDGDIVLIDAAASYKFYNADITRTIPVSGRYTARQKQVYNAVLDVHKAMKASLKAGIRFSELLSFSHELLCKHLIDLKLISMQDLKSKGEQYWMEKYCYHEYSHTLGLSVHDVGDKFEQLPENAVITIEPGIYIQEENIGVRIENNVVVTNKGMVDLSVNIPIEADAIEEIMNK